MLFIYFCNGMSRVICLIPKSISNWIKIMPFIQFLLTFRWNQVIKLKKKVLYNETYLELSCMRSLHYVCMCDSVYLWIYACAGVRICKHVDEEIDLDGISAVYVPTRTTISTFVTISLAWFQSTSKSSSKKCIYRRAIRRPQRVSHSRAPVPFSAEEKCPIWLRFAAP